MKDKIPFEIREAVGRMLAPYGVDFTALLEGRGEDSEGFINPRQAGALIGMSPRFVKIKAGEGCFRAHRLGDSPTHGKILVHKGSLLAWVGGLPKVAKEADNA